MAVANLAASSRSGCDVSHHSRSAYGAICQSAGYGLVETRLHLEEALVGSGPGAERAVCRVDVAGEQVRRVGVGAGDDEDRHPADVGGEPGGGQRPDMLGGGNEDLAAHVPAFLLRGELVLEVHTGGPGLDERLGQLEDVERSAEPGFAVGDDREPSSRWRGRPRPNGPGRRGAVR